MQVPSTLHVVSDTVVFNLTPNSDTFPLPCTILVCSPFPSDESGEQFACKKICLFWTTGQVFLTVTFSSLSWTFFWLLVSFNVQLPSQGILTSFRSRTVFKNAVKSSSYQSLPTQLGKTALATRAKLRWQITFSKVPESKEIARRLNKGLHTLLY